MNRASLRFFVALAALALLAAPRRAEAQHPELQRARALFEQTAFEDARAVLDAVQDDAGFTRDDVVDWLVLRARIASALGDPTLADRELTRLATLVDEVALPPDLRARFDALAGAVAPLSVELRWEDGVLEAVTAVDDPVLVRDVRVTATEDGEPRTGSGRLAISAPSECRAVVIGPGGAVLASASGCPASARATEPEPEPAAAGGIDVGWMVVGISAGVLVAAAAIVLGIVFGTAPEDVRVQSIVVHW